MLRAQEKRTTTLNNTVTPPGKILLLIFNLAPGGAERVLVTLANGLCRVGLEVVVCTIERESVGFYPLAEGVHRLSLSDSSPSPAKGAWARPLNAIRRLVGLRRLVRNEAPMALISFVAPLNVIVLLASIGMRHWPRVIVSERNDPQRQKLRQPLDWLRRKLYRHADIVTANTQGAIDYMQAFVPGSKLFCIPNAVSPPVELSETARLPVVLNMARLHPQKGQDILLEAFVRLPETTKAAWSLKIIGEGTELDNLRRRASLLGLPDSVLTGKAVANPWPEYAEAGIFVLPSRFEGLPNVLLEAMSMGCACIVSDASPGPLEFLEHGHSGLVFTSGDVLALSQSLQQLMENPGARDRLGRNAQAAVAGLSEDRILGQWMSILQ